MDSKVIIRVISRSGGGYTPSTPFTRAASGMGQAKKRAAQELDGEAKTSPPSHHSWRSTRISFGLPLINKQLNERRDRDAENEMCFFFLRIMPSPLSLRISSPRSMASIHSFYSRARKTHLAFPLRRGKIFRLLRKLKGSSAVSTRKVQPSANYFDFGEISCSTARGSRTLKHFCRLSASAHFELSSKPSNKKQSRIALPRQRKVLGSTIYSSKARFVF